MMSQIHTTDGNALTAQILRKAADDLDDGGDDDQDDGDDGDSPDPIMAAIESGSVSATDATRLRETARNVGMDAEPIIDVIAEHDIDVETAIDLLETVGSSGGSDPADEDETDHTGELKADVGATDDDVEQKARTGRTLGEIVRGESSPSARQTSTSSRTLGDIVGNRGA